MVGYEVVSVSGGNTQAGSAPSLVSAEVNMANVQVNDDYTLPVTFIVTSLLAENEICNASQTSEPSALIKFNAKQTCYFCLSVRNEEKLIKT